MEIITLKHLEELNAPQKVIKEFQYQFGQEAFVKDVWESFRASYADDEPSIWLLAQKPEWTQMFVALGLSADSLCAQRALERVAEHGRVEVVKVLLDAGAGVHIKDSYALWVAARNGHADVMRLLLRAAGYARWSEIEDGHTDVIEPLLRASAEVHEGNAYCLHEAAERGHAEVVKLLLEAGADVHAGNDRALWWAAVRGHAEVVKLLLGAGADVHWQDDLCLRKAARKGYADVVKLLLEAGADVNAKDGRALYWAAANGHTEVVRLLLAAGATVSSYKDDALWWAMKGGHSEVAELLCNAGAHVSESALSSTSTRDHMVRQLLSRLNAPYYSLDALYWAVTGRAVYYDEEPQTDVVQLLLHAGADVHMRGDSPLRGAVETHHIEIARILLAHGANIYEFKEDACSRGALCMASHAVMWIW